MRKNILKMMVVAGIAALIIPTAAMAEWEEGENHDNQLYHDEQNGTLTDQHAIYGFDSQVGYDLYGDGTATSSFWTSKKLGAPKNTTPCPWNILTGASNPWQAAGTCPSQTGAWDSDQTGGTEGYANDDVELFGVILDDLYQSMEETAFNTTQNVFKKVSQVVDILFYRSNTEGEAFGLDGWVDTLGEAGNAKTWFGGIGIDQTLDQDVADVEGTTGSPNGTDRWSSSTSKLWKYDHIAQTFYQDFRLFDRGNTFGTLNSTYDGKAASTYSPRTRHGMELLALCRGGGSCSAYDIESDKKIGTSDVYYHLFTSDLDAADFAFFDQWVIQSLKDSYDYDSLAGLIPYSLDPNINTGTGTEPAAGFEGNVVLKQSYSSWMVQGAPGDLCSSINVGAGVPVGCKYTYDKKSHEVVKDIPINTGKHQTGDP